MSAKPETPATPIERLVPDLRAVFSNVDCEGLKNSPCKRPYKRLDKAKVCP